MAELTRTTTDESTTTRGTTSATRARLGRSGPRSRTGCGTCKQRRVRCDEGRPVCGHCARLQLSCEYVPRNQRMRKQHEAGQRNGESSARSCQQASQNEISPSRLMPSNVGSSGPQQSLASSLHLDPLGWQQVKRSNINDWAFDLDTSWAGEFSCLFPDVQTPSYSGGVDIATANGYGVQNVGSADFANALNGPLPALSASTSSAQKRDAAIAPIPLHSTQSDDTAYLIHLFRQIVQPPAAILIGGFERWRLLQHYLCKLSEGSRAVNNALLCVIETLVMDQQGQDRNQCTQRILERHTLACNAIRTKLLKHSDAELKPKTREVLLASIFLLAWFEVIRDQNAERSIFPRDLADQVLLSKISWGRYSQQLLSWLNTLDCKATHLGGENLLSPSALAIVSHYPTQITSSLEHDDALSRHQDTSDCSFSDMSPGSSYHSVFDHTHIEPGPGDVKQMMLHTILQPALQWYLTSQSYCRRISANDKHHRSRFTSEDEYEVITACKQLESQLFDLWESRPSVMTLSAEQLGQVVTQDMAYRLQEIFSVYLASFWVLFVYLHRTCWWTLPHSAITKKALEQVWLHLQRAYGEKVDGHLSKVLHPALLWPLFLFGSECTDPTRQAWAIEQLEALGEAKPVLEHEDAGDGALPQFRLSAGATRNAKRAAALLQELVKEQETAKARVDDRDLSMRLFGCYFSIV